MSMTNPPNRIDIVTSVQRRRRWTASEKVRMAEETFEPGMTAATAAAAAVVACSSVSLRISASGGLLTE